jgi:hypothetical protein
MPIHILSGIEILDQERRTWKRHMSTESTMAVPIPDTLIFIHLDGLRNMKLLQKRKQVTGFLYNGKKT